MEDIRRISLCANCKHAATCTFPKDPDKPSFFCEEFELAEVLPRKVAPAPVAKLHLPKEDESEFKGLCSDCENRKTCKFPKPEGGVWHCQEYR
ncbi:MAG: hypothetical protein JW806_08665 [Sedimentisphaerales bacterium]|nr:hypothetical protein [Sedimentisphaerales bacterium]